MFTIKVYEKDNENYKAYSCVAYSIHWRAKRFGLDIEMSSSMDFQAKVHTVKIRPPFQMRSMVYIENVAGKTIDRFEIIGQHIQSPEIKVIGESKC